MLSVRLPEEIESRLNYLAARTNRTKSFYAVEALKLHIEELEDLYLGVQAHEEFVLSGEKALSTEEVEKLLDL